MILSVPGISIPAVIISSVQVTLHVTLHVTMYRGTARPSCDTAFDAAKQHTVPILNFVDRRQAYVLRARNLTSARS